MGIYGEVKKVSERSYYVIIRNDSILKGNGVKSDWAQDLDHHFDDTGNLITTIGYYQFENKSPDTTNYFYDESNLIINITGTDWNRKFNIKYEYNFSDPKNIVLTHYSKPYGRLESETVTNYNLKGNKIYSSSFCYYPSKQLCSKDSLVYNKKDQLIKHYHHRYNDSILRSTDSSLYNYNNYGNIIMHLYGSSEFDKGNTDSEAQWKYKYTYDISHNWIQQIEYQSDTANYIRERIIIYKE